MVLGSVLPAPAIRTAEELLLFFSCLSGAYKSLEAILYDGAQLPSAQCIGYRVGSWLTVSPTLTPDQEVLGEPYVSSADLGLESQFESS